MAKGKNKSKNPAVPKCSVCDGKRKVPNPEGGKKVTCPYCQGSGEEPDNNFTPEELEDEFENDEN